VGGDGTVARVAKELVGRGIPVAPLPGGTANNITRTLGLVGRHWEELVHAWPRARRVRLDLALAKGPWGERYFIEGAGLGLFAGLLGSADPRRGEAGDLPPAERTAFALEILEQRVAVCEPIALKATLDGKDLSGSYLMLEALNIPYVGPNLFLAPDSQPGDGTLDVVLVREEERERLKNNLASWQSNRERLSVLPTHRGRHLRMEWSGFDLHIDDELCAPGTGAVELRMADRGVEFIAPDSRSR
jgi:diacylglycerol kinase family enzyme